MASWILAAVILGTFLLFAGGAWLVAIKTPQKRQRRSIQWKIVFLSGCGIALSAFAFWTDRGLRQSTLHEVILDGASNDAFSDGDTVRVIEFAVEHPGVEHKLSIGPMHRTPTMRRSSGELQMDAELSHGDSILLSERLTFSPQFRDTRWRAEYRPFTPTAPGRHTLTLQLLTPDIPAIHVRIADPLKTDGKRISGY
jgi:hypothetical protein